MVKNIYIKTIGVLGAKYLGIFARPGYSSILLRVFFLQMQTAFYKVLLPEVL